VSGFDRDLNSFVQAYHSKRLDAGLLLMPLVGFLPPEDLRVRGTLRAIEERGTGDYFPVQIAGNFLRLSREKFLPFAGNSGNKS
jgi:hypothetical protein